MKKRIGIGLLILISAFTVFFLLGATKRSFELSILDGSDIIFQKNYNIKLGTRVKVLLLYKGSYKEFFFDMGGDESVYDELNEDLKTDIEGVVKSVEYAAKDASVRWDGKAFFYTPEQNGVGVDRQALAQALFAAMGRGVRVALQKNPITPALTERDLRKITVETASFSTNYSNSSPSRKHNIGLAAHLIDGSIIKSGEKFSFNSTVGKRTIARGFMEAKIISGGKFVKGVGGGVCQVSTTLYNAALRAGLSIAEVSNHSLPVAYVPLSFDAMVASSSDLIIENTTGHPIYIKGESDGSKVKFTFFGCDVNSGYTIKCRTEIIKVLNSYEFEDIHDSSQLEENMQCKVLSTPKCGYITEGYIDKYKGEKLVSTKKIRRDVYKPQKGVRVVPNKPIETPIEGASDKFFAAVAIA